MLRNTPESKLLLQQNQIRQTASTNNLSVICARTYQHVVRVHGEVQQCWLPASSSSTAQWYVLNHTPYGAVAGGIRRED